MKRTWRGTLHTIKEHHFAKAHLVCVEAMPGKDSITRATALDVRQTGDHIRHGTCLIQV